MIIVLNVLKTLYSLFNKILSKFHIILASHSHSLNNYTLNNYTLNSVDKGKGVIESGMPYYIVNNILQSIDNQIQTFHHNHSNWPRISNARSYCHTSVRVIRGCARCGKSTLSYNVKVVRDA